MTPLCDATTWLVDSHVHVYDAFDWPAFLRGAVRHFQRGARDLGLPRAGGVLCLTEDARHDVFARLRTGAEALGPAWRVRATADDLSLWIEATGHLTSPGTTSHTASPEPAPPAALLVLRGIQRATAEGLEVSSLCGTSEVPDGQFLADAFEGIRRTGGVPVIPWGFGKWWFGRGAFLERFVRETPTGGWFLGDNSGRTPWLPEPAVFHVARARGIPVLPGSDPLDMGTQQAVAGRYGFRIDLQLDAARPGESLREALRNLRDQPPIYGSREPLAGFVRNQITLRIRARQRRRPAHRSPA